MNKENVEQIIKELANDNFRMYPESYHLDDNLATNEASENVQELGISYFQHRNEHEIERDEELNISQIDYVEWCMEEFSNLIEEK